jgi:beta-xylosidase
VNKYCGEIYNDDENITYVVNCDLYILTTNWNVYGDVVNIVNRDYFNATYYIGKIWLLYYGKLYLGWWSEFVYALFFSFFLSRTMS